MQSDALTSDRCPGPSSLLAITGDTLSIHTSAPYKLYNLTAYQHPSWRNWLARQTVNLEALSSILSGGEGQQDLTDPGVVLFFRLVFFSSGI